MTQQFKSSGIPLFKIDDIPAMDPNCCCDGCGFFIYQDNCQIFWYVVTDSIDFDVEITGPGSSDNYDYHNITSGLFDNPTDGLWLGVVTLNDVTGGCLSSVEYAEPEEECLPCCRNTVGINFSVHAVDDTFEESRQQLVGGVVYERLYHIWDLSEFHLDKYLAGSMSSGSKTSDNCYDQWGTTEEITIGEATFTRYTAIPHTNGDPVCVGIPADNYYYQRIYYDIIVRFNITTNPKYLVLLKVTAEDYSIVGTPEPGGTNPPAPTIGAETDIFNPSILGSDYTLSWAACHFIQSTTTVGAADYTDCVNSGEIILDIWPDVSVGEDELGLYFLGPDDASVTSPFNLIFEDD